MKTKAVFLAVAASVAMAVHGAWLDENAAAQAVGSFLETSTGRTVLPQRTVESMQPRGSLWVAALSPSGHVLVSRSDRATPIRFFRKRL